MIIFLNQNIFFHSGPSQDDSPEAERAIVESTSIDSSSVSTESVTDDEENNDNDELTTESPPASPAIGNILKF